MILLIEHTLDWGLILQKKQTQINKDKVHQNRLRVEFDYEVIYNIMLTNHTAYKNETPYKGPFVVPQLF